jgi:uncharacterized membrane protein YeaQ/YmgE (transglycosylase-associated protein family)
MIGMLLVQGNRRGGAILPDTPTRPGIVGAVIADALCPAVGVSQSSRIPVPCGAVETRPNRKWHSP